MSDHVRCRPGESVFEAAERMWGKHTYVDTSGTLSEHWEVLGTVTVRPHETFKVYRIPEGQE